MMKTTILTGITAFLLNTFLVAVVHAANNNHWSYMGASYGVASVKNENSGGNGKDPNRNLAIFRMGTHVHKNFSIELRTGVNLGNNNPGSLAVNNVYALYLKPEIHISNELTLNMPIGYGAVEYDRGNGGKTEGESFSYGLGAEYSINEHVAFTADIALADKERSLTASTYSFGVSYFFDLN